MPICGSGEAIGPVGAGFALGQIARGLEIAAARIVDDAVLQSVLGVAAIVDFGGEGGQLVGGDGRGLQGFGGLHVSGAWCR